MEEKDFPASTEFNASQRENITSEQAKKLFDNFLRFNEEIQIVIMNLIRKYDVPTHFVLGCLEQLKFGLQFSEFSNQLRYIEKFHKETKEE